MCDEVKTKVCSKCKIEKVVAEFYRDKSKKDGVHGRCKECEAEYMQKYRQENTEKETERKRKWQQENAEKVAESVRKWRQENPEKVTKYNCKYTQENREKESERARKYYQEKAEYAIFLKHLEQEEAQQQEQPQ